MKSCPFCAQEIQDAAIICKHCHKSLTTAPEMSTEEKPYYQEVFTRIENNGGGFMASWNWASFLFSGVWYLVKGLWVKCLLLCLVAIFSGGFGAPFIWIYTGVAGNYDYYLLRRKRKQLW